MSTHVNFFANHGDTTIHTRLSKIWEHEKYADEDTSYSFAITSNEGDNLTLFLTMGQLEALGDAIDKFIASAVDVPQPTINDLVRSQAESEQTGFSLA